MMPLYYVAYTRQNNYCACIEAEDEEEAKTIVEDDSQLYQLINEDEEKLQRWGEARLIEVKEKDVP